MHRLAAVLALIIAATAAPARADTTRVALIVGNNLGGRDMPPLRYAEADASKVASVLVELGNVDVNDLQIVRGQGIADIETALRIVGNRVTAAHQTPETRVVLYFYFSGHSDGEALEIRGEALPYSRLKSLLAGTGADVRLVIIDACRSGDGFRTKGGHPVEPFAISLADRLNATGEAFISSSAANEAALESAEVMGSIFTHALVSGLRGAADTSGDRQITLGEAYRYAYEQTVARTAVMPVGSQHPNYDFRIAGQGDLVLTSLDQSSAMLVVPGDAQRAVISDLLRDQVIAEMPIGAAHVVALPAGNYGIRLFKGTQSYGGRITLEGASRTTLEWSQLKPISSSVTVAAKGGVSEIADSVAHPWSEKRVVSVSGGVAPSLYGLGVLPVLRAAFEPNAGPGFSFGVEARNVRVLTVAEGAFEVRAGYKMAWQRGPFDLSLGAELGPGLVWAFDSHSTSYLPALTVSPRFAVRLALVGPLSLGLDVDGGLVLLVRSQRVEVPWVPSAVLGLALKF